MRAVFLATFAARRNAAPTCAAPTLGFTFLRVIFTAPPSGVSALVLNYRRGTTCLPDPDTATENSSNSDEIDAGHRLWVHHALPDAPARRSAGVPARRKAGRDKSAIAGHISALPILTTPIFFPNHTLPPTGTYFTPSIPQTANRRWSCRRRRFLSGLARRSVFFNDSLIEAASVPTPNANYTQPNCTGPPWRNSLA